MIGANILNVARQDYDPQGASVTILISEELVQQASEIDQSERPGPLPDSVVAHLDKSHISVHTYPESHPDDGICTFRPDIEVSTCGVSSPLQAPNYLSHKPDSVSLSREDRVRGCRRDVHGVNNYIDDAINSAQNFVGEGVRRLCRTVDGKLSQDTVFHTKLMAAAFGLDPYLLPAEASELGP